MMIGFSLPNDLNFANWVHIIVSSGNEKKNASFKLFTSYKLNASF